MTMTYRPDIDGLRAISILSVLLFHAHVPGFSGGFVGVDVFFVISGFLIGSILLLEIKEGSFSFANFYQRRIRRILPTLLVVLVTTSTISWFLLLPQDFVHYWDWVGTAIFMVPNILARIVAGDYFAPPANYLPLLHLWSLGVEEQFYLLFPLFLLIVFRQREIRMRHALMWSSLIVYFIIYLWMCKNQDLSRFYLLLPRAWELLLGVIIAYYYSRARTPMHCRGCAGVLSIVGMLLILLAVVNPLGEHGFSDSFMLQLLAVAGAMILITTGNHHQTAIHTKISSPWAVWVGKISYSLYLWHWPLLSLFLYWEGGRPVPWHRFGVAGVLLISVLFSALTWKYIEQPFRNKRQYSFRLVLLWVGGWQAALLMVGALVLALHGMPQRFSPQQVIYAASVEDITPLHGDCDYSRPNTVTELSHSSGLKQCVVGNRKGSDPTFLVWGDSHAEMLVSAFDDLGTYYKRQGLLVTFSGHPTLLGVGRNDFTAVTNEQYHSFISAIVEKIQNLANIKDVFLANYYAVYAIGRSPLQVNAGYQEVSLSYASDRLLDSIDAFRFGLSNLVSALVLAGKNIWIVLPVPEVDRNAPAWLARHVLDSQDVWITGYPDRRKILLTVFNEIKEKYGDRVHLLDPFPLFCRNDNSECIIARNGRSLYRDDNHLSATGARFIEEMLRPAFAAMAQASHASP